MVLDTQFFQLAQDSQNVPLSALWISLPDFSAKVAAQRHRGSSCGSCASSRHLKTLRPQADHQGPDFCNVLSPAFLLFLRSVHFAGPQSSGSCPDVFCKMVPKKGAWLAWSHLVTVLDHLGTILAPSWVILAHLGSILCPSWDHLWQSSVILGASGTFWRGGLGGCLGYPGTS